MVYEKRNQKEWTLSYVLMGGASPDRKNFKSSWEEPDGTVFKVMGRYPSLELADRRKAELEATNLVWGVLEVEMDDGTRGIRIERVSRDFPKGKKVRRLDGLYRLEKTCRSGEEAAEARDKMIAKADKKGKTLVNLDEKEKRKKNRSRSGEGAADLDEEIRKQLEEGLEAEE